MFTSPIRNSMLAFSLPMFDDDQDTGGGKGKTDDSTGKESSGKDKGSGYTPPATQEDLDALIQRRLAQYRRTAAPEIREELEKEIRDELAAEKAKEDEDYKALYEAAQKKVEKYEAEKKASEHETLRQKVARDAGLPESSMKFLVGETEAELKASAKELGELVKPKEATDTDTGKTNPGGGNNRRTDKKEDYDDPAFWNIEVLPPKQ